MKKNAEGEDDAIHAIAASLSGVGGERGGAEVWIGDDAAVLAAPAGSLLLTSDAVVAGVHLDMDVARLDDLGWKAMAASLSDIAAMGGIPRYALVSVITPPGTDLDLLYEGIAAPAAAHHCPVVGGDLSNPPPGSGVLAVTVTVSGDTGGSRRFARERPVLRSGARAEDAIFVTGPLGASAAGLARLVAGGSREDPVARAYLRPIPRVAEGRSARAAGATAMIDVSDGLSLDLHRLADASGVGFEIDELPVADGADESQALGGGEDYELIVTTSDPRSLVRAFADGGHRPPVFLGRCAADPALRRFRGEPLDREGWQHRF